MSPFEKRFDAPFDGSIILFENTSSTIRSSKKDKHRLHQFGIEVLPDVFIGYTLHAGGGWTEDLLIADWDELEKNVAPEVHVKRFKSAELIRISCRWVLQTRRARSTSCLAIRTKANRDHRCGPTPFAAAGNFTHDTIDEDVFFKTERDDFVSISGNFMCKHHVIPRDEVFVPQESPFPILLTC